MQVWAVANQKGGVGQTTTVVSCAGLLAEAQRRVLVVDLDPHGSLTSYFRHNPDQLRASAFDLFRQPQLPSADELRRIVLPTSASGLMLFPAGSALATVERQFRSQEGVGLRVARALELLRADYDYVLIDTPPVLGVLMINALAASERLLLPVQTDYLAIKGLERMAHTLAMVVRARGRQLRYTVVPTMYEQGSETSVTGLRSLLRTFADHVAESVVPLDNIFREASLRGLTPSQHSPYSRGVKAYRSLLRGLDALPAPAPAAMHPVA